MTGTYFWLILSLLSGLILKRMPEARVSFETSFDSKQPKLEPKLVSALSETQRLFRLFRFYTETESVSIEPKQTKDKPKQFHREHILQFFTENLWFFRFFRFFSVFFSVFSVFFLVFSVCFEIVCFGVSVVSLLNRNREFRLIRNKQKTHPNSSKESIFGYFPENFGLFRFEPKQTETRSVSRLFRFVSWNQ